mmetsp:Transcript_21316/g.57090  ORF Transcript_21316/g.57090 Transcript_21316/m.57090 type:complete len:208 (+) Transcript_21316:137-760(+)
MPPRRAQTAQSSFCRNIAGKTKNNSRRLSNSQYLAMPARLLPDPSSPCAEGFLRCVFRGISKLKMTESLCQHCTKIRQRPRQVVEAALDHQVDDLAGSRKSRTPIGMQPDDVFAPSVRIANLPRCPIICRDPIQVCNHQITAIDGVPVVGEDFECVVLSLGDIVAMWKESVETAFCDDTANALNPPTLALIEQRTGNVSKWLARHQR